MPLIIKTGDILTSDAEVLVVPVNTVGVMGAGLAKQVAKRWSDALPSYQAWCRQTKPAGGSIGWSDGWVWFATKEHWRQPSELSWIEKGLRRLVQIARDERGSIDTIALPLLGCGLGGLNPAHVGALIGATFGPSSVTAELWLES